MLLPIYLTSDVADRRRRPRLRLTYPLRLYRHGETFRVETRTEDISCEGFFCVVGRKYSVGEILECELVIPSDELGQSFGHDMVLRCRAEVVRVAPQADRAAFGLACRLADYTIGPQIVEHDVPVEVSS